jgi:hypothetical protein
MVLNEQTKRWEYMVAENRLTARHKLAKESNQARRKKSAEMRKAAQKIEGELERGKYLPRLMPPEIEVAWIVGSRLAWLGPKEPVEGLWEDMADTDPASVLKAEAEGPEAETDIPEETIASLVRILNELESLGHNIKGERFSQNWQAPLKGSNKSKESLARPKEGRIKRTRGKEAKPKPPEKKWLPKKKRLSSFFEPHWDPSLKT